MLLRPARGSDRADVEGLLRHAGLPLDGVAEHLGTFIVAEDRAAIVGVAGLEIHGRDALLRSVVVVPEARGRGLGAALTQRALAEARSSSLGTVYLLTSTAEAFFPRFGFERITWDRVPVKVQESREFHGACPSSAVAMRAVLDGVVRQGSAK
jgi:amino-acid N-acetyltransferase